MSNPQLLNENDLQQWTGYTRKADIEKFCREHGIKIIIARSGGICTTLSAVEEVLLDKSDGNSEFDDIGFA